TLCLEALQGCGERQGERAPVRRIRLGNEQYAAVVAPSPDDSALSELRHQDIRQLIVQGNHVGQVDPLAVARRTAGRLAQEIGEFLVEAGPGAMPLRMGLDAQEAVRSCRLRREDAEPSVQEVDTDVGTVLVAAREGAPGRDPLQRVRGPWADHKLP